MQHNTTNMHNNTDAYLLFGFYGGTGAGLRIGDATKREPKKTSGYALHKERGEPAKMTTSRVTTKTRGMTTAQATKITIILAIRKK